jgi:hypothetical protein
MSYEMISGILIIFVYLERGVYHGRNEKRILLVSTSCTKFNKIGCKLNHTV